MKTNYRLLLLLSAAFQGAEPSLGDESAGWKDTLADTKAKVFFAANSGASDPTKALVSFLASEGVVPGAEFAKAIAQKIGLMRAIEVYGVNKDSGKSKQNACADGWRFSCL